MSVDERGISNSNGRILIKLCMTYLLTYLLAFRTLSSVTDRLLNERLTLRKRTSTEALELP